MTGSMPTSEIVLEAKQTKLGAFLSCLILLSFALLCRLLMSSGFIGSDETAYAIRALEAARGSISYSTYVGDLRYGVNLPMALFVIVLGANEPALHMWALLCSIGEVALVFYLTDRLWGRRVAWAAALLLASAPLHIHAGGRALADAPLAFFATLGMTAFLIAERSGRKGLYLIAGAAIGFTWWIKPHAVIFGLVLLIYALLCRRWDRNWNFVLLSFALVVSLEFLMFTIWFGDSLHGVKSVLKGVANGFVDTPAPWGSHDPVFYFRWMFLDGRGFFFVPFLALLGLFFILNARGDGWLRSGGYVVLWALGFLAIFSFTPYSFSPFRLIPKQENYALIFLAPLAILGGYGLVSFRFLFVRSVVLAFSVCGGIILALLPQYEAQMRQAALDMALDLANANPGTSYLPRQALLLEKMRGMLDDNGKFSSHTLPLDNLIGGRGQSLKGEGRILVVTSLMWPELVKSLVSVENNFLQSVCASPKRFSLPVMIFSPGTILVDALIDIRKRLPLPLARQLNFAVHLKEWPPLNVQTCGLTLNSSSNRLRQ